MIHSPARRVSAFSNNKKGPSETDRGRSYGHAPSCTPEHQSDDGSSTGSRRYTSRSERGVEALARPAAGGTRRSDARTRLTRQSRARPCCPFWSCSPSSPSSWPRLRRLAPRRRPRPRRSARRTGRAAVTRSCVARRRHVVVIDRPPRLRVVALSYLGEQPRVAPLALPQQHVVAQRGLGASRSRRVRNLSGNEVRDPYARRGPARLRARLGRAAGALDERRVVERVEDELQRGALGRREVGVPHAHHQHVPFFRAVKT